MGRQIRMPISGSGAKLFSTRGALALRITTDAACSQESASASRLLRSRWSLRISRRAAFSVSQACRTRGNRPGVGDGDCDGAGALVFHRRPGDGHEHGPAFVLRRGPAAHRGVRPAGGSSRRGRDPGLHFQLHIQAAPLAQPLRRWGVRGLPGTVIVPCSGSCYCGRWRSAS